MTSTAASPEVSVSTPRLPRPVSERAVRLKRKMSPERWASEVREAKRQLRVVRKVERLFLQGFGPRAACLRKVDSGVPRTTYYAWRRRVAVREGPEWERLLDGRTPQPQAPVDPDVRAAAELLRRTDPLITYREAREHLVAQFGSKGWLSDSTLARIWRKAGLTNLAAGDARRFERVEYYPGGGALVLIGGAAAESGILDALARAALEAGKAAAAAQGDGGAVDTHEGRESGRFTAAYNRAVRQGVEAGQPDARWQSDRQKREERDLSSLAVLTLAPETLAQRFLVMAVAPMLSRQRGFDGLETPQGQWVKLLGGPAYSPDTLDKTINELGQLGTDEALNQEFEKQWGAQSAVWSAGKTPWKCHARYYDITGEPHWTNKFAKSGKVSRTGRVMPCLQRVTVTAYPGIVVRMRTFPGSQSLCTHLRAQLTPTSTATKPSPAPEAPAESVPTKPTKRAPDSVKKTDTAAVPAKELLAKRPPADAQTSQAPFQLTVADAEAGKAGLMWELNALPNHAFITILKGNVLKGATILETGPWQPYRKRDRVREVRLKVSGKGAPEEGVVLRGVQMERRDSRHPHDTMFATDAAPDYLSTTEVADAHLARWRYEEHTFRGSRHGAGLERSQGYTGEMVPNETLGDKRDKAQSRVERTRKLLEEAQKRSDEAEAAKKEAKGSESTRLAARRAKEAARALKQAQARHDAATKEAQQLETTPEVVFQRDTTRENIATATKLSGMAFFVWALIEYFGGLCMELSTFLDYYLNLPVEVRTTWCYTLYRIDTRGLPGDKAELLRRACAEMTQRRIRRLGRWLKFEAIDMSESRDRPP